MGGIVVFDIDGTLSIPGDRLKHIQGEGKKDWNAFYDECGTDAVNAPVARVCRDMIAAGREVMFVTGRPERVRDKTYSWLVTHGLLPKNGSRLLMRADGDFRPDHIVKPELVAFIIKGIDIVFEDRDQMVKAWRDRGIACMQVAYGDY